MTWNMVASWDFGGTDLELWVNGDDNFTLDMSVAGENYHTAGRDRTEVEMNKAALRDIAEVLMKATEE